MAKRVRNIPSSAARVCYTLSPLWHARTTASRGCPASALRARLATQLLRILKHRCIARTPWTQFSCRGVLFSNIAEKLLETATCVNAHYTSMRLLRCNTLYTVYHSECTWCEQVGSECIVNTAMANEQSRMKQLTGYATLASAHTGTHTTTRCQAGGMLYSVPLIRCWARRGFDLSLSLPFPCRSCVAGRASPTHDAVNLQDGTPLCGLFRSAISPDHPPSMIQWCKIHKYVPGMM